MNPKTILLILLAVFLFLWTPVLKITFAAIGMIFSGLSTIISGLFTVISWPLTWVASGFFSWNPGWILVIIVLLILYARKSNTSKAN